MRGGGREPEERAAAEAVFRAASRPARIWPVALAALVLYVLGSSWGFVRELGSTGRDAQVQAAPSVWVLLALAALVAAAHLGRRVDERAGQPPWRWPARIRRVLAVLTVVLPLVAFGVAPVAAITAVDAGRTEVPAGIAALVHVGIVVR